MMLVLNQKTIITYISSFGYTNDKRGQTFHKKGISLVLAVTF
jgi:hypothetical protein